MAEQTIATIKPVEDKLAKPVTGSFAPQLSTHWVTEAIRGRQTFNDSDKDNYFEG
ncbi:hypothetical protein [Streptomyces atriruber]|uniref:hypothetical protein n=1 Tax=Streptomyces atriruber TaxID=545121 RepID=UPI000AE68489|nr:hypothetical protein [Streptomyces atriruber]